MRRVTRNVGLEDVRDLLERVPRACVSFVTDAGPEAEEVRVETRGGAYWFALGRDAGQPAVGDEVVLLVDDGVQFFDLRALYMRGTVASIESRERDDDRWCEVRPTKRVAWDYGTMRYE